jgi:hypothetical protein
VQSVVAQRSPRQRHTGSLPVDEPLEVDPVVLDPLELVVPIVVLLPPVVLPAPVLVPDPAVDPALDVPLALPPAVVPVMVVSGVDCRPHASNKAATDR